MVRTSVFQDEFKFLSHQTQGSVIKIPRYGSFISCFSLYLLIWMQVSCFGDQLLALVKVRVQRLCVCSKPFQVCVYLTDALYKRHPVRINLAQTPVFIVLPRTEKLHFYFIFHINAFKELKSGAVWKQENYQMISESLPDPQLKAQGAPSLTHQGF